MNVAKDAIFINKLLIHSIGWITILVILSVMPIPPFIENPLLYRGVMVGLLLTSFYINYLILVPQLRFKNKKWWYMLSLIGLLASVFIVGDLLNSSLIKEDQVRQFAPTTWSGRPIGFKAAKNIPITLFSFIGILISSLIRFQERAREKELEVASVKAELLHQELNFLKSQINPHFLFNALNNIYSLAINKSDKVGTVIIKLSEMLRYIIYDFDETKVQLSREVKHIQNYIELQRIKDPGNEKVTFAYDGSDVKISPLLLMPFVENSYKHSKIDQDKNGWIKISIQVIDGKLSFQAENSVPNDRNVHMNGVIETGKNNGIGIENVRKRLDLIYRDLYKLEIKDDRNVFEVKLELDLDHEH